MRTAQLFISRQAFQAYYQTRLTRSSHPRWLVPTLASKMIPGSKIPGTCSWCPDRGSLQQCRCHPQNAPPNPFGTQMAPPQHPDPKSAQDSPQATQSWASAPERQAIPRTRRKNILNSIAGDVMKSGDYNTMLEAETYDSFIPKNI